MKPISRYFRSPASAQRRDGQSVLLADDIEAALDAAASNVILSHDGQQLTALSLERRASIFARWALRMKLRAGDRVAVALPIHLDYVAVWIGLAKIGVCPCLIPTHLPLRELIRCVVASRARTLIADPELAGKWRDAAGRDSSTELYVLAEDDTEGDIGPSIDKLPDFRPDRAHREHLTGDDPAMVLFTSGTSGPPRPITLNQNAVIAMMRALGAPARLRRGKRILSVLPLYHHLAGVCGVGAAVHNLATMILFPRFSVGGFWQAANASNATGFLHSGEMCRMLMAAPPGAHEHRHDMVEAIGSGMSEQVAAELAKRTSVRKLTEVYGASEALVMMAGPAGRTGSIGKPALFGAAPPEVRLARYDPVSGQCVRGDTGRCIEVRSGESGEALVRIRTAPEHGREAALVDAFAPGDMWCRTGDIMSWNGGSAPYRLMGKRDQVWQWRGETVYASVVEEALLAFRGIAHVCSYGVAVPGKHGAAVMVCVVPSGRSLDLAGLGAHMVAALPPASVPLFVRLRSTPILGPAFFHQKAVLAEAGFDPSVVSDPMYFNDGGVLGRLDEFVYERLCSGDLGDGGTPVGEPQVK